MSEDYTEEELALLAELEKQAGGKPDEDYPEAITKDSVVKFLRDVMNNEHYFTLAKTGNLDAPEIGTMPHGVRTYLDLANFNNNLGYDKVAGFLRDKSNVIVGPSLSKKGFFLQLLISQKKFSRQMGSPVSRTEKGLFKSVETREGYDE